MTRAFTAALLIALLPTGAAAATSYAECAALVETDPERARSVAADWYAATGALGALHCEALALAREGAFRTAARKLAGLAGAPELSGAESAAVRLQAAKLYRADGDIEAALATLDAALDASGAATAPIHIERAALHAAGRNWPGAKADLDAALKLAPQNAEALALRAAARRHLGDEAGGRADAKASVAADPDHAPGWLELGVAERARGARAGARKAFFRVLEIAPASPSAGMARNALQEMAAPGADAAAEAEPKKGAPPRPSPMDDISR